MKKLFVLLFLLVFVLTGCASKANYRPRFLQVDFPDSPEYVYEDGSKHYVVKITNDRKMMILGTVEEVYPEFFIDGEGLPLE